MQFLTNLPFQLELLPTPVYAVGGAVRDELLGRVRSQLDLDLVVPRGAIELARTLAAEYRAGFVILDAERYIARVVFPEMTVDIAQQEGESIDRDLARRDFTLNAIAYDLQTQRTIDPFNGTQDIQQRTIRMISKANLIDDPLRLLRAYRQGAQLDFSIESATLLTIRELAPLLTNVSAERVLAELRYLLQTPNNSQWLQQLADDRLLTGWLKAEPPVDLSDRLAAIDRAMALITQHYPALDRELNLPLRDTIPISRQAIGKFTILLSPNKYVATAQMSRLTFSASEAQTVTAIINHLPHLLAGEMSLELQYFWFQSVGNNFPVLILMAIARGVDLADLRSLIDRYLDPHDLVAHPVPLLNGNELMQALAIPPSPQVGKLLTEIQLARITGKVTTPAEAIEFAREVLKTRSAT